ncbi:MAG: multidrug effflux MFS transporter [Candidatus Eremiobacteraeota bacterium]|nr:multidrug effflux MFS transporter [Candidatus Eremiobacteraeota bacterium]
MEKEQRVLILVLGCLAAMGPMSIDLYLPAFPLLEAEFATNAAAVSNTMASYFVGISVGQMIYGPVSDSYGRRGPLLIGLILYLVGSVLCAASTTIEFLVAARVLQALGGCAGMVICRAVVRDLFHPAQMARVFSALLLVMGIAPILAPTVGAVIVDWQGWRPLFLMMGAYGLFCLLGTLWKIPTTHPTVGQPLSLIGSFRTFGELLRHRGFLAYSVSSTFVRVGLFGYITGSPFLFQNFYGMTPKVFGIVFGANAAGFVVASQVNSRLVEKYGHRRVYGGAIGFTTLAVIPLIVIGTLGTGPLWLTEFSIFTFISSLGFLFPCATTGALEEQPDRAGSASALMGLMGSLAAALTASGVGHLQTLTPVAMPILVGWSCVLACLSFVAILRK